MMLPPSCPACRPYRGLWRRTADGSLARCDCARGRMLSAGKVKRVMGRGATRQTSSPVSGQSRVRTSVAQTDAAGRPCETAESGAYERRSVPPVREVRGKLAAAGKD